MLSIDRIRAVAKIPHCRVAILMWESGAAGSECPDLGVAQSSFGQRYGKTSRKLHDSVRSPRTASLGTIGILGSYLVPQGVSDTTFVLKESESNKSIYIRIYESRQDLHSFPPLLLKLREFTNSLPRVAV
jgi:hypothetical protein